jgi:pimeloyl-ACP methyl ester carboxylesterase
MRVHVFVSLAALAAAGCFDDRTSTSALAPDGGLPGIPSGPGVGAPCMAERDCRDGLVCHPEMRTCQPGGNRIPGASCVLSAECLPGNYCSQVTGKPHGVCTESGVVPEGGQCSSEGDCQSGLLCALTGLFGTCEKAGQGDFGQACTAATDCRAGLICTLGRCQTILTVAPWAGASGCPTAEESTGKVHFQVPREGDPPSEDYFRLPFPNDIRKKNGKISFQGFPRPGARFLPLDPVELYLQAIQEDGVGFGLNPTVYFRFSREPALGEGAGIHKDGAVSFFDITADRSEYGSQVAHGWNITTARTNYICPRFLSVRPDNWRPLRPGRTYAVVLTNAITDRAGIPMRRDADFDVMLEPTPPADTDLAAAWQAYSPLRRWIADKAINAEQLVAAAVFTTDKVDEPVAKLRTAVWSGPAPTIKEMIRCGAGRSPCDDGQERGCRDLDPAAPYDEFQGKIVIPVFQKGKVPFELPTDGGGIETGADGLPLVQRMEEVCFSLTVPKGTAPAEGWPVVVSSHGTGGNFRSHVDQNLAAEFAIGDLGGGSPAPMAMFGYDGVLHGPRKGSSSKPESELVFNFLNPRAARDNSLQGAADLFAIARALEDFSTGGVKLDGKKVGLYGHSQGGNAAALASAYEPTFGAVVLSGTGGALLVGILEKKNPVSVAGALPIVLGDPHVDQRQPVMNLLQMYFDPVDPLNFARRITFEPDAGQRPKHLLHVFGSNDTYSPDSTQNFFAQAAGLPIVHPVVMGEEAKSLPVIPTPVSENFMVGMTRITAVQAQYAPSGYDGHFVSTQNPNARAAIVRMLGTYARDGKPVVE